MLEISAVSVSGRTNMSVCWKNVSILLKLKEKNALPSMICCVCFALLILKAQKCTKKFKVSRMWIMFIYSDHRSHSLKPCPTTVFLEISQHKAKCWSCHQHDTNMSPTLSSKGIADVWKIMSELIYE